MMQKTALITGLNGFTGQYIAQKLTDEGYDVFGTGSHAVDINGYFQVDLLDQAGLLEVVQQVKPDVVVHLAAIAFVGHADDAEFYRVNVVGTTQLLSALTVLDAPPKILLASSANVYGNCLVSPIAETQPPSPVNHYAMSKLAMELMAKTYLDRLPIVIARPFNYTGAGQSLNFIIPKLVDHFARRLPAIDLGNLQVEREFNDVHMVCDAYSKLLQYGVSGEIYNICSGQPHALQSVIDALSSLTKHSLQVKVNPKFVRANEVHRLCGDSGKLHSLLTDNACSIDNPPLEKVLQDMLAAYSS